MLATAVVLEAFTVNFAPFFTVTARAMECPSLRYVSPSSHTKGALAVWSRIMRRMPVPFLAIAPSPCGSACNWPVNVCVSMTSPPAPIVIGVEDCPKPECVSIDQLSVPARTIVELSNRAEFAGLNCAYRDANNVADDHRVAAQNRRFTCISVVEASAVLY